MIRCRTLAMSRWPKTWPTAASIPRRHQVEGVAGGDKAVVWIEFLERRADDADDHEALEALPESNAHRFVRMN
jgi:hypothetical protein